MLERKENIKVLTKEDVISLSNNEKRRKFLEDYEKWGIWLDIDEIKTKIFKAVLPGDCSICITRFKNYSSYGGEYSSPVYRFSENGDRYGAWTVSWAYVADKLKQLKIKFAEEKKNAGSDK